MELHSLNRARVRLLLPCNAAACVGNYFRAEVYRTSGWNTWREADARLRDLRRLGRVAMAAVDSSILETAPGDPRGAIVLETEMERAKSPDGKNWGTPCWRWFRPTGDGSWAAPQELTEALMRGVRRVDALGTTTVLALVNPRAYFLVLAAAVEQCGLLDRWVLFRAPAHPRHLLATVRQIAPLARQAASGTRLPGGVYLVPRLLPAIRREYSRYREAIPPPWAHAAAIPARADVKRRWTMLEAATHQVEVRRQTTSTPEGRHG